MTRSSVPTVTNWRMKWTGTPSGAEGLSLCPTPDPDWPPCSAGTWARVTHSIRHRGFLDADQNGKDRAALESAIRTGKVKAAFEQER